MGKDRDVVLKFMIKIKNKELIQELIGEVKNFPNRKDRRNDE